MRFTSGFSEFLHNYSGLSVAQFCVVSLNFVTVRWFWISVEIDLLDHSGPRLDIPGSGSRSSVKTWIQNFEIVVPFRKRSVAFRASIVPDSFYV